VGTDLPEIVIVPAHPAAAGREHDIVFEVRHAAGGMNVLPVFSTVQRLVETLGHSQPWVALPLARVRELTAAAGVPEVALDPCAEPDAWRWQQEDLATLQGSLE
jgi:hypothetical protein